MTTSAEPEDLGLSSQRLARIGELLQRHIRVGDIAGAVALVGRRGQAAYLEAFGMADDAD